MVIGWDKIIPTIIIVPLFIYEIRYGILHPELYQGLGGYNHYSCIVTVYLGSWFGLWFLVNLLREVK